MPGHEVDYLWCDLLGGADQIALIFAIFVVNDDDHLAVAYIGNGLFNSRNRHGLMLPESNMVTKVRKRFTGLSGCGEDSHVNPEQNPGNHV